MRDAFDRNRAAYMNPFDDGDLPFATVQNDYRIGPRGFDPNANFLLWGRFWSRTNGGHNARVSLPGVRRVPTTDEEIAGTGDGLSGTTVDITLFPWIESAVGDDRIAIVTAVGKSGVENKSQTRTIPELRIQKSGGSPAVDSNAPNPVKNLHVTPTTDGKFIIYFTYDPKNEAATPATFNIYWSTGGSAISYSTPNATVSYVSGVKTYSYTTGVVAGSGDTIFDVVVRATATDENRGEERNRNVVRRIGRTSAPYTTVESQVDNVATDGARPLRER